MTEIAKGIQHMNSLNKSRFHILVVNSIPVNLSVLYIIQLYLIFIIIQVFILGKGFFFRDYEILLCLETDDLVGISSFFLTCLF